MDGLIVGSTPTHSAKFKTMNTIIQKLEKVHWISAEHDQMVGETPRGSEIRVEVKFEWNNESVTEERFKTVSHCSPVLSIKIDGVHATRYDMCFHEDQRMFKDFFWRIHNKVSTRKYNDIAKKRTEAINKFNQI